MDSTTINNSYAIGNITGTTQDFGGLVANTQGSNTANNSFWDTQTSGMPSSAAIGGIGLQTSDMTNIDTFTGAGWDFDTVWGISGTLNMGYPYLQWQTFADTVTEAPQLLAPLAGSSHTRTEPMTITFVLPETPHAGSIHLTFVPDDLSGSIVVLDLMDANPLVENSFTITPSGGISTVTEVVNTTADSIPNGDYTITLAYQDILQNAAAIVSVSHIIIQDDPAPTVAFTGATPDNASVVTGDTVQIDMASTDTRSGHYAFVDMDNDLLGWWRFEGNADDDSSYNSDGLWSGTEAYGSGKFGDA